ncbi:hypothetical protein J3R82DRAFT_8574, partial [Butyriboletus roseoflavus]
TTPHADSLVWKIIHKFATIDLSLSNAKIHLQAHFGGHFIDVNWQPVLWAVMNAKWDAQATLTAINPLKKAAIH